MTVLISNLKRKKLKTENIFFKKDKRWWKINIFSHCLWWGVNTIKSKASKGNIARGASSFSCGVHPHSVLWREGFVNTIYAMKKMQRESSVQVFWAHNRRSVTVHSIKDTPGGGSRGQLTDTLQSPPLCSLILRSLSTPIPWSCTHYPHPCPVGVTWLSELHQEVQETSSSRLPFTDTFICVFNELYWQGIWKSLPSVKINTAIRSSSSAEVKYCDILSAGKDKVTVLIRVEMETTFLEIHLAVYGKFMNSSHALRGHKPSARNY